MWGSCVLALISGRKATLPPNSLSVSRLHALSAKGVRKRSGFLFSRCGFRPDADKSQNLNQDSFLSGFSLRGLVVLCHRSPQPTRGLAHPCPNLSSLAGACVLHPVRLRLSSPPFLSAVHPHNQSFMRSECAPGGLLYPSPRVADEITCLTPSPSAAASCGCTHSGQRQSLVSPERCAVQDRAEETWPVRTEWAGDQGLFRPPPYLRSNFLLSSPLPPANMCGLASRPLRNHVKYVTS